MPKTDRSTEKATIALSRIVVAMFRVPRRSAPTSRFFVSMAASTRTPMFRWPQGSGKAVSFVVRSIGGDIASTIALSNVLRDRHATAVVHDYCLSSCANYLLIASSQAYVLKGTLVAWDYESSDPAVPSCARFAFEDAAWRLPAAARLLSTAPADEGHWRDVLALQTKFFRGAWSIRCSSRHPTIAI